MKGDEKDYPVCITSPTRLSPTHAWSRAASHVSMMLDVPMEPRIAARIACWDMVAGFHIEWGYPVPAKPPQFSYKGIPGKL